MRFSNPFRAPVPFGDEPLKFPVVCTQNVTAVLKRLQAITVRTYGTHKKLPGIYFAIFTNNIWSKLHYPPVIAYI